MKNKNLEAILQSAHSDAEATDRETQIIHRGLIKERDQMLNNSDSNSRVQNIDELTDMGFNIMEYSPIPMVRNTDPLRSEGNGTNTHVPTSTPRTDGRWCLNSSDPTHNKRKKQIIDSFTGNTCLPESQQSAESKLRKRGKKMSLQGAQGKNQPQPSTSLASALRNTGTSRLQVQCSACGGNDHFRNDCQEDNYCTQCRSRSDATNMCQAPAQPGKTNNICIYCGSKNTPLATHPAGPVIKGKNLGQHQGISTVMDHNMVQVLETKDTSSIMHHR